MTSEWQLTAHRLESEPEQSGSRENNILEATRDWPCPAVLPSLTSVSQGPCCLLVRRPVSPRVPNEGAPQHVSLFAAPPLRRFLACSSACIGICERRSWAYGLLLPATKAFPTDNGTADSPSSDGHAIGRDHEHGPGPSQDSQAASSSSSSSSSSRRASNDYESVYIRHYDHWIRSNETQFVPPRDVHYQEYPVSSSVPGFSVVAEAPGTEGVFSPEETQMPEMHRLQIEEHDTYILALTPEQIVEPHLSVAQLRRSLLRQDGSLFIPPAGLTPAEAEALVDSPTAPAAELLDREAIDQENIFYRFSRKGDDLFNVRPSFTTIGRLLTEKHVPAGEGKVSSWFGQPALEEALEQHRLNAPLRELVNACPQCGLHPATQSCYRNSLPAVLTPDSSDQRPTLGSIMPTVDSPAWMHAGGTLSVAKTLGHHTTLSTHEMTGQKLLLISVLQGAEQARADSIYSSGFDRLPSSMMAYVREAFERSPTGRNLASWAERLLGPSDALMATMATATAAPADSLSTPDTGGRAGAPPPASGASSRRESPAGSSGPAAKLTDQLLGIHDLGLAHSGARDLHPTWSDLEHRRLAENILLLDSPSPNITQRTLSSTARRQSGLAGKGLCTHCGQHSSAMPCPDLLLSHGMVFLHNTALTPEEVRRRLLIDTRETDRLGVTHVMSWLFSARGYMAGSKPDLLPRATSSSTPPPPCPGYGMCLACGEHPAHEPCPRLLQLGVAYVADTAMASDEYFGMVARGVCPSCGGAAHDPVPGWDTIEAEAFRMATKKPDSYVSRNFLRQPGTFFTSWARGGVAVCPAAWDRRNRIVRAHVWMQESILSAVLPVVHPILAPVVSRYMPAREQWFYPLTADDPASSWETNFRVDESVLVATRLGLHGDHSSLEAFRTMFGPGSPRTATSSLWPQWHPTEDILSLVREAGQAAVKARGPLGWPHPRVPPMHLAPETIQRIQQEQLPPLLVQAAQAAVKVLPPHRVVLQRVLSPSMQSVCNYQRDLRRWARADLLRALDRFALRFLSSHAAQTAIDLWNSVNFVLPQVSSYPGDYTPPELEVQDTSLDYISRVQDLEPINHWPSPLPEALGTAPAKPVILADSFLVEEDPRYGIYMQMVPPNNLDGPRPPQTSLKSPMFFLRPEVSYDTAFSTPPAGTLDAMIELHRMLCPVCGLHPRTIQCPLPNPTAHALPPFVEPHLAPWLSDIANPGHLGTNPHVSRCGGVYDVDHL